MDFGDGIIDSDKSSILRCDSGKPDSAKVNQAAVARFPPNTHPIEFSTVQLFAVATRMPHIDVYPSFREEGISPLQNVGEECQRMARNFALVHSEAGRGQETLKLTEQVIDARKTTLGKGHPDTLRSMHNLANN